MLLAYHEPYVTSCPKRFSAGVPGLGDPKEAWGSFLECMILSVHRFGPSVLPQKPGQAIHWSIKLPPPPRPSIPRQLGPLQPGETHPLKLLLQLSALWNGDFKVRLLLHQIKELLAEFLSWHLIYLSSSFLFRETERNPDITQLA